MIESEMLLDILTPDTIQKMGQENIDKVKKLGEQSNYLITLRSQDPYQHKLGVSYETKRIKELSRTAITKELSYEETILFKSELKFVNNDRLLNILKENHISLTDLQELNQLVVDYQKANIEYTMAVIKLEDKYNFKIDQAIKVIKLYPSLVNSQYIFNDEDKSIYLISKKILVIAGTFSKKKEEKLAKIRENSTIKKLEIICKNHFGYSSCDLPIVINKINETIATDPVLVNKSLSNQKVYK